MAMTFQTIVDLIVFVKKLTLRFFYFSHHSSKAREECSSPGRCIRLRLTEIRSNKARMILLRSAPQTLKHVEKSWRYKSTMTRPDPTQGQDLG